MARNYSQAVQSQNTPGAIVSNEGTVFPFSALTEKFKRSLEDNLHPDSHWFGSALVLEHRYAWAPAQSMKDEGLVLQ